MASIVSSKQRQANTCAAAASQYATSGQHQKAVDMYVAAIDALMAVRSKVDARARPAVDRQMEEYLGQAEVIKRRIKVAQPQPPARSSQLPPPVSAPTAAAAAAGATASAAAAAAGTGGAYYAARHVPTPPERCKHTHSFVHSSACVLVCSDCLYLFSFFFFQPSWRQPATPWMPLQLPLCELTTSTRSHTRLVWQHLLHTTRYCNVILLTPQLSTRQQAADMAAPVPSTGCSFEQEA